MLKSKLALSKKKITILTATALCVVLIASSALYLFPDQVAQAAIINPHPGLVGWWNFNEGSGTIADDSSGNGNNGTINGAAWTDGVYGKALSFDGSNAYVSIPNNSSLLPPQITVEAWIKRTLDFSVEKGIVTKGGGWGTQGWSLFTDSSMKPKFIISNAAGDTEIVSPNALPLNTWRLVAATYDGSNLRLYENGVQVAGPVASTRIPGGNYNVAIGRLVQLGSNNYIPAQIDEVRVYNRALTAADIQADFKDPDFAASVLAKIPQGTTQVIATLSWQGTGNINATIQSPSQNYTENMLPEYQKSSYSTSNGITSTLNIKRLSVSINALSSDQNWYIVLTLDKVDAYQITVEVQK
jgi:hypothetical protein